MRQDPFFVGWSWRSTRPLAPLLLGVVVLMFAGFGGLALALGSAVNDPGGGDFPGDKDLSGALVLQPYPMIVLDPDPAHPVGHAVLMSGNGKRGVMDEALLLPGKRVRATGFGVARGGIDMLVVDSLVAVEGRAVEPRREPLGQWRLTGEICDGKCVLGVMRPGAGLSHKACANLCLVGGVPPVLVTTAPVAGSRFLLMGSANGQALPDALRDHTAIPQRMDGALFRVADMLVFETDVSAAVTP